MKRVSLILLILIAGISIYYFGFYDRNNQDNKINIDKQLENIGYKEEDIVSIKKLNTNNIDYLVTESYQSYINELIINENFEEIKLKNYINFKKLYDLEIDDVLYIVNKEYDNLKEYNEKTVKLMKQEYYIHNNFDRYQAYKPTVDFKEEVDELNYIITCVNSNLDYEFYTNTKDTNIEENYLMLVNKYNKLSDTYVNSNLVNIEAKHGRNAKLESKTYEQYIKMYDAAKKQGLNLYIKSPYRSYSVQNNLYNNYVAKDGKKNADTYSARPGYSEHQTGLAFDLTSYSTNFDTFENSQEFKWVKDNAHKYGFILRYPKGMEYITGYIYEPWHYRYVGEEVAKIIYEKGITFEEYHAYYVKKDN